MLKLSCCWLMGELLKMISEFSDRTLVVFSSFLAIWYGKYFLAHLVYFLLSKLEYVSFSKKSFFFFFSWKHYFKTISVARDTRCYWVGHFFLGLHWTELGNMYVVIYIYDEKMWYTYK